MSDHIGLYYPYFTFPNDAWVKLAALYWDKLGRILPPDYAPPDSDTVQRLQGELDFTKDFTPSWRDTHDVGKMFIELLFAHERDLYTKYSISTFSLDKALPKKHGLSYVYADIKMSYTLVNSLRSHQLAIDIRDHQDSDEYSIIGMHPKLASVYM